MPTIRLTAQAFDLMPTSQIKACARQSDGTWLVELGQKAHDAIADRCGPGETYSEAILRISNSNRETQS